MEPQQAEKPPVPPVAESEVLGVCGHKGIAIHRQIVFLSEEKRVNHRVVLSHTRIQDHQ